MPFNSKSMIGFQEREEEAQKATRIPEDTYILEITDGEVFDSNGVPRLRLGHKTISAKRDGQVGRFHTEFLGWFASETSESPKPIEERTDVSEIMEAIGAMLVGQLITGQVKYSKTGDFVNLYANTYDESIGAADAVAV